jgi:hypothetical protein
LLVGRFNARPVRDIGCSHASYYEMWYFRAFLCFVATFAVEFGLMLCAQCVCDDKDLWWLALRLFIAR